MHQARHTMPEYKYIVCTTNDLWFWSIVCLRLTCIYAQPPGRSIREFKRNKKETIRHIFQATHRHLHTHLTANSIYNFLNSLCLMIFFFSIPILAGNNSAEVWRRLLVRFIAIDAASHREPIPKYLNNVRFGDIRYAKATSSSELCCTTVEPNIAAKYALGRCIFVRCTPIGGIATKYDTE